MKHWDKMAQSLVEKYDVISIRFNLQFTMSLIFPGIKENGSIKLTFLRATSMQCTMSLIHIKLYQVGYYIIDKTLQKQSPGDE